MHKFCGNCGTKLTANCKFCVNCGTNLDEYHELQSGDSETTTVSSDENSETYCKFCNGKGEHPCEDCKGTGNCYMCLGSGICVWCSDFASCDYCQDSKICMICKGSGKCNTCEGKKSTECKRCEGTGLKLDEKPKRKTSEALLDEILNRNV